MRSACVDYERAKSFVALGNLPEEHDHFRCAFWLCLTAWNVRSAGIKGLVQDSCHSINDELEILRAM
jgi:hypothetical protein